MNEQIMKSTLTGIDDSDKQKSICNVCGLKDNILFLEKIFGLTNAAIEDGFYIRIEKNAIKYMQNGIVISKFNRIIGNNTIINYFANDINFDVAENLNEKIDHLVEDLKYWTDEHRMDHGIFMYEDI